MSKTGPTPNPNADTSVSRRRVPGVELAEYVITLPGPRHTWLSSTATSYDVYCASLAARVLREEDVAELMTMWDLMDQRSRYVAALTGIAGVDHKALQAIRIADGMIDRKAASLGIGPLARARLGIQTADAAKSLKDLMADEDDDG